MEDLVSPMNVPPPIGLEFKFGERVVRRRRRPFGYFLPRTRPFGFLPSFHPSLPPSRSPRRPSSPFSPFFCVSPRGLASRLGAWCTTSPRPALRRPNLSRVSVPRHRTRMIARARSNVPHHTSAIHLRTATPRRNARTDPASPYLVSLRMES
ncbi:hypothetical protein BC827DRAFT_470982 [Russula dissimulans]|nr:hypothetical protein BC827DRAFT_470982 [Russula dissimulans]